MENAILVIAALMVGIAVGVAGCHLWCRKIRPTGGEPVDEPELPRGVPEVLAVLRSAAVVVDVADGVVKASPASYTYGLVRAGRVVHDQLVDLIQAVRQDGVIRERELDLPRGPIGPGLLTVHARVAPLGPLHVLLLVEDRTESRRLEMMRRDFVVNVSHELKTPVGAIALLAETISDSADDAVAVRRFAGRLETESERLTRLVQEIIDLSRLQVNHGIEQPDQVDVDSVVFEAIDRSRVTAAGREVDLHVSPPSGAVVFGERELLVTAVRNLIDNAIRYSDPRTRVGIGVRCDDRIVEVAVADQGIGIEPKDLSRVFERFFRVDPARSRETGGTGLGLSIVKHVAANHGGDVVVWSRKGQGSTFTLRIPSASSDEHASSLPYRDSRNHRLQAGAGTPLKRS